MGWRGGGGLRRRDRGTLWGRESLKMPRDKRITDQYGRMDFVILKMAVRAVHSHLLEVRLTRPSITPLLRPSNVGGGHVKQERLGLARFPPPPSTGTSPPDERAARTRPMNSMGNKDLLYWDALLCNGCVIGHRRPY